MSGLFLFLFLFRQRVSRKDFWFSLERYKSGSNVSSDDDVGTAALPGAEGGAEGGIQP